MGGRGIQIKNLHILKVKVTHLEILSFVEFFTEKSFYMIQRI